MKTKIRKTANILIRAAIVILTLAFIYDQIFYRKDYQEIMDYFPIIAGGENFYFLLSIVLLLIPVNIFLEIWKWKYLIKKLEKVSYWNATKAILTGYSVSMFLPNRVGEYFGRIYVLKKAGRIRAILVTILGSMAQLLTTSLFGLIALAWFLPKYVDLSEQVNRWLYFGLLILTIVFIVATVFAYLNFSSFTEIIKRISGHKLARINKFTVVFSWYSSKNLAIVLGVSILRYLVFSFQFFLLLLIFHVPINYFNGIAIISVVYLLMTIIPTIALTELGVRGSVSLFVFGLYFETLNLWNAQMGLGVVSASTLLWLFNLAFPALLGTIFVYSLRFFRTKKNDIN
ncbi:MAG TPA: lysylphosphatidylglycerol synthase domain-containing protein [Bacteroidales bacterium]